MHNGSNTQSQVQPVSKHQICTALIIKLLVFGFFWPVSAYLCLWSRDTQKANPKVPSPVHYYLALQSLGAQGTVMPQHVPVHCRG